MMPLIPSANPETHLGLRFDREARFASARPDSQSFLAATLHTHLPSTPVAGIVRSAPFAGPRTTMPWLAGAFALVDQIDQEAEEEGYPPIGDIAKKSAKSVLFMAGRSSLEPAVYPSMDGEIALYFKSRTAPAALLILLDNEGGAGCYWSLEGMSEHQRHDDASQLPEDLLQAHLRALGGLPLSQSLV